MNHEPIRHPDDPGEPTTGVPRIAIDPAEGELLSWLATGRRVLEVGTGLGGSTRALATTAFEVDTVDIDPWVHEVIVPDLPGNVRAFRSIDALRAHRLAISPPLYDLVFIDGAHDYASVCHDILTTHDLLKRGGVMVFHDWHHDPVGHAASELLGDYELLGVGSKYGVGIAIKPKEVK